MTSLRMCSLVVGVAAVAAVGLAAWIRAHRKSDEQKERERRARIAAIGRITDGTVIDVHQVDDGDGNAMQLVMYAYEIAGVEYQCSQDVRTLRDVTDIYSLLGLPASVKYDPHNPGDSIVIAEGWSGLRR